MKVPKLSWHQGDLVIRGAEMGTGSNEKLGLLLLLPLGNKTCDNKGESSRCVTARSSQL